MRIALVTEVFLPAVDGVVTRLQRTLEELQRHGDEVLVIAPAGGPGSYAGSGIVGVPGLRVPLYPDGSSYPEKRVSLPVAPLRQALRLFAPDVIHAVNPVSLAAGAVRYARRNGVPLVASYHAHVPSYAHYYRLGLLEGFGWRYVTSLHNQAQLNLCTSNATREILTARGVRRLELWSYGVDAERFSPSYASRHWRARLSGVHPDRAIVLYVGELAKEKSIPRLLPAVRDVAGVSLAIVADGPLRAQLQRQFAGTQTTLLGLLDGDDLARAYASADAFVFPSESETLGMVMIEAHASGLPVIAADCAATREVVRAGIAGLHCDPSNPRSLTGAVLRLGEDRCLRTQMALHARRSVAGATWAHATRVLREHYLTARSDAGRTTPAGMPDPRGNRSAIGRPGGTG